jgi:hypothetical protein
VKVVLVYLPYFILFYHKKNFETIKKPSPEIA